MIVFISASEEDEMAFRRIAGAGRAVVGVSDVAEARRAIQTYRPLLVVCDTDVRGAGSWRDLLDARGRSSFELVVVALHADDRLWAEVLNLGGYDVLAKPFCAEEVERSISAALRHAGCTRVHSRRVGT